MKIGKFGIGILLLLSLACTARTDRGGGTGTNENAHASTESLDKYRLPSGREIVITGMNGMNFDNGETGLVLNYETEIPIENIDDLKKEVEEVWTIFRNDVEKANTTTGIIRATHVEERGVFAKHGTGYGFVYRKSANGNWVMDGKKD